MEVYQGLDRENQNIVVGKSKGGAMN